MTYTVLLPRTVQKALDRLPDEIAGRVLKKLGSLQSSPRPTDGKKLKGRDAWRVRVGDYRIIYEIESDRLLVYVLRIGHRRDVYR